VVTKEGVQCTHSEHVKAEPSEQQSVAQQRVSGLLMGAKNPASYSQLSVLIVPTIQTALPDVWKARDGQKNRRLSGEPWLVRRYGARRQSLCLGVENHHHQLQQRWACSRMPMPRGPRPVCCYVERLALSRALTLTLTHRGSVVARARGELRFAGQPGSAVHATSGPQDAPPQRADAAMCATHYGMRTVAYAIYMCLGLGMESAPIHIYWLL
jgi:hypothetical protein